MSQEAPTNTAVVNDVTALTVSGHLDITVVGTLEERLEAALKESPALRLELDGVERVDAAALQLLHLASLECRRLGGELTVAGPSAAFDDALRLLGLETSIVRNP